MKASIIIPSFNARERLYFNLISLNCQDYPHQKFEVIVVDNGSTDQTMEMLAKFKAKYRLLTIRLNRNKCIPYARNRGIAKASGDILIFHDSDMIAAKDYVRKHIEAHENQNTVVCGLCWRRIYTYYYKSFDRSHHQHFKKHKDEYVYRKITDNIYQLVSEEQIVDGSFLDLSFDLDNRIISALKETLEKYGKDLAGYHFPWRYFLTNNASVHRNKVLEVGMFDEKNKHWGFEDFDLGIRLYKSGCTFLLRHDIVSVHQEHRKNYSLHEFTESLNYMFEKYDDINHLDMLLILTLVITSILFPDITIIKEKNVNELMDDINKIKEIKKYHNLLNLFRELLQIIRKNLLKPSITHLPDRERETGLNFDQIKQQAEELQGNLGITNFVDTLFRLVNDIYKIDLKTWGDKTS